MVQNVYQDDRFENKFKADDIENNIYTILISLIMK